MRACRMAMVMLCFLLLSACVPAAEPQHVFILPAAEAPGAWKPEWVPLSAGEIPYQYSNIVKGVDGARVWDMPDGIIMTAMGENNWYFGQYDKFTGRFETYCSVVACRHNHAECPVGDTRGLDERKGTVYVRRSTPIMRDTLRGPRPAAGNNRSNNWICKLSDGRAAAVAPAIGPAASFLCGENGFYIFRDAELLYLPYGAGKTVSLIENITVHHPVIIGNWLYATDFKTIYRVNLAGPDYTPETLITDCPRFNTDGRHLYYAKDAALYRCALDGTGAEIILSSGIDAMSLSFDEEHLYYIVPKASHAAHPNQSGIYRMPLDGSGNPALLLLTSMDIYEVFALPTSPDALLVNAEYNYYFLPNTGGELVKIDAPYP